jgi:hypothetical protein
MPPAVVKSRARFSFLFLLSCCCPAPCFCLFAPHLLAAAARSCCFLLPWLLLAVLL